MSNIKKPVTGFLFPMQLLLIMVAYVQELDLDSLV